MKEYTRKKAAHFILLMTFPICFGIEHNLPDNVELVNPKDLGLDDNIDLSKLLGNVKALPIDTNAISSALGKTGLKTQVLTVGFDGSEGLNLDDFELPQLKNDEHAPLAQAAFSSFKSFLKNSTVATQFGEDENSAPQLQAIPSTAAPRLLSETVGPKPTQQRTGKRRTMMKRRKVLRNGTAVTPQPQFLRPLATEKPLIENKPKVIELDPSQIEKLIATGKIGPPRSLTPGGPQVIELGQSDLDRLLSSENGAEIKTILENADTADNVDASQILSSLPQRNNIPQLQQDAPTTQVTENSLVTQQQTDVSGTPYQPTTTVPEVTTYRSTLPQKHEISDNTVKTTAAPAVTQSTTTGFPIIYHYSSTRDDPRKEQIPPQGVQGTIPLQFYSSQANGEQQSRLVKTPTFEFISAPPISFSSSILAPSSQQNQVQQQQQQQQQQLPQQIFFPISPVQKPAQLIVPSKTVSSQQQQQVLSKGTSSQSNYIQNLHKVTLPFNSVHSVINQAPPASFQPSVAPNHIVKSPINALQNAGISLSTESPSVSFLRPQPIPQQNEFLKPFKNTQLFNGGPSIVPPTSRPLPLIRLPQSSPVVRFQSSIPDNIGGGHNRFRTAESSNPFFSFQQNQQQPFGNLILSSFVAGDGLNYEPKSRDDYSAPGI